MTREALAAWTDSAAAWMAGHPAVPLAGLAAVFAIAAVAFAVAAWRAGRRTVARTQEIVRATADIEAAVTALSAEMEQRDSRFTTALEQQKAVQQDNRDRLRRLEEAVKQLRADVIEQQTAKYRINEAIRQAMER